MDEKTLHWVNAVLHNDEASSDEELVNYFMRNGISEKDARDLVAQRQVALLDKNYQATIGGTAKNMDQKTRLSLLKRYLQEINLILNKIIKIDPYGDVIENFTEGDKETRHTDRIIAMINKDLKRRHLS